MELIFNEYMYCIQFSNMYLHRRSGFVVFYALAIEENNLNSITLHRVYYLVK